VLVCGFFFWGYLKSGVFQTHPAGLNNLKQRISEEINAMSLAILLCIMESVTNWLHQCISLDGQHLMGVILKK